MVLLTQEWIENFYFSACSDLYLICYLLFLAKKASGMLSFFRGTAGKSPDLSSQKRETLRGADSAYYQVGQTGKEGTENQGIEPQGVLKETNMLVLGFSLLTSVGYVSYSFK